MSDKPLPTNVLGGALEVCCLDPVTGYFRDGYCNTTANDLGRHLVCAVITDDFLRFSKSRGNDLVTPRVDMGFPGLRAGDSWCLCIHRWMEAEKQNCAPKLKLRACHENTLQFAPLELLERFAFSDG